MGGGIHRDVDLRILQEVLCDCPLLTHLDLDFSSYLKPETAYLYYLARPDSLKPL
jgi:hypothetical protein